MADSGDQHPQMTPGIAHLIAHDSPELVHATQRVLADMKPEEREAYFYYANTDAEVSIIARNDVQLTQEALELDLYASARMVAMSMLVESKGFIEELIFLHSTTSLLDKLTAAHDTRHNCDFDPLIDESMTRSNVGRLLMSHVRVENLDALDNAAAHLKERALSIMVEILTPVDMDKLESVVCPTLADALSNPLVLDRLMQTAAIAVAKQELVDGREYTHNEIIAAMEEFLKHPPISRFVRRDDDSQNIGR